MTRAVDSDTGKDGQFTIDHDSGGLLAKLVGAIAATISGSADQGTKTATATNAWPVRLYDGAGALLGRLAAAASLPVVLSNEDKSALDTIAAAQPYLKPPGSHTAITPSDATDTSAIASIGLLVTSIAGGTTLDVRGTTTTGTTVSYGPVVAGQYVYGSFSRVMAATNCTVMGLAP